ncbi:MAG: hypothetical protein SFV19_14130 [Rhodospirillaceae bacterium]|nr:hypothetical protein [Rhodospirillaceae bacterium]
MRTSYRLMLLATAGIGAMGLALASAAADDIPTVKIPDEYVTGIGPAGLERPASFPARAQPSSGGEKAAALNGTLYAVVAPTYNGAGGTLSYLRLFNGASAPSNFSITVVGSPTGRTYGTANIQVGRSASPQYTLTQILQNANAAALNGGDTSYALYIQNPDAAAGYQHVTYNSVNGFFENVSVCNALLNQAVGTISSSAVLTNVHTSRIAGYPSQVEFHNYWNAPVTYRVTLVDSATGTVVGSPVNVQTAPNASYSMPFTFFEQQAGWAPTANQFHANLVITDTSGGPPYNLVGQSIVNSTLSANVSMSTACAVNKPASAGDYGGGPGLNGY